MRYGRCQCGKATAWTTDSFQDCQGCDVCGTTFAGHPDFHKPKIAHDWEPRFDTHTGQPSGRQCARCHAREKIQDENVSVTADAMWDEEMSKNSISQMDRHALIGVFTVISRYRQSLKDLERVAAEITGAAEESPNYFGHVSDFVWADCGDADALLRKMEIKVQD